MSKFWHDAADADDDDADDDDRAMTILIVNNYSEIQVNILSNNRDIRKCQSFCMKILSRKRGITLSK